MGRFILFAALAAFPIFQLQARLLPPTEYDYPISDPLQATLAARLISDQPDPNEERLEITLQERNVRNYSDERRLQVLFHHAPGNTKLLYILTGLGSTADSRFSQYLAHLALYNGVASVVFPDTFTANFVIAASQTGLVGLTEPDSRDLYQAMAATRAALSAKGYNFKSASLLGYSHGGLLAPFINKIDLSKKQLGITSTLLINPPVDLLQGIRTVDRMFLKFEDTSIFRLLDIKSLWQDLESIFVKSKPEPDQQEFLKRLDVSSEEAEGLIAKSLKEAFKEVILASQAIRDLGILPRSPSVSELRSGADPFRRLHRAQDYTCEGYVRDFFGKQAELNNQPFDLERLNKENGLLALEDDLKHNFSIRLLHNRDDFLLQPGDVEWLEKTFGKRAMIFPNGGHLGNLSYGYNARLISQWLVSGAF